MLSIIIMGSMCPPRDAISLATAIIKLAEEKQFIESLTANAREHVATKSWSHVFDQLVNDYCSVLEKTRLSCHKQHKEELWVKISIIGGTGYVGLITGLGLAVQGHDVICMDGDETQETE